jgi:hypothetical protein
MAHYCMGMGEALVAAALTPNNKHQFGIWTGADRMSVKGLVDFAWLQIAVAEEIQ